MSSFSDISQETQAVLDTISSSMPPSRIERLWDCIHWWCARGNFLMRSHFLEIVFGKLFKEYERKISLHRDHQLSLSNTRSMRLPFALLIRWNLQDEWLGWKLQNREDRLRYQRYWQWHRQPQLQWLQPQGHHHQPQNLHQQQGEPPQPTEELLILACQILTALPEDDTLMGDLVDGIMCADLTDVPIEKAASYLPTELLNRVRRGLQAKRGLGDFRAAAETLKKIARERSLQDLCVRSTLEAVKGDAGKVWSLSELPEPLKELFHVPFLALYNKQR